MKAEVANAGAGSGKTTYLVEWLAGRIIDGADPSRILATTFTRSAAAQLRARLEARLLAEGGISGEQQAKWIEGVELATIGTIHSVGAELLSRFALRHGLSPGISTLDEHGQEAAFAELLNSSEASTWLRFNTVARRFKIKNPANFLQRLIANARTNCIDWDALGCQLEASAADLVGLMKLAGGTRNGLVIDDVPRLLGECRDEVLELARGGASSSAAAKAGNLSQALLGLSGTWHDFKAVAKHGSGRGAALKEAVAPLAELVPAVFGSHCLHEDVYELNRAAARACSELGGAYQKFKVARGLVDFTDQETWFLDLVRSPSLEQALTEEIQVVAVDEFQDTNPIQLAIFQRLEQLAQDCLWVGDGKQAIYGFRDADPELVAGVWRGREAVTPEALAVNRRSCAPLVRLVGEVFGPVLGPDAVQRANEERQSDRAVERWVLEGANQQEQRQALVAGIERLRDEGWQWGDIAVLARTNTHVKAIAEALSDRGVRVSAEVAGLLSSRECAVALAGLALVADGADALAAATVVHLLGPGGEAAPSWLEPRLGEAAADGGDGGRPWAFDENVCRLRSLGGLALGPREALENVIAVLSLPARLSGWGSASQRSINLDRMLELTQEYESTTRMTGRGVTVGGLVGWLESRGLDNDDTLSSPREVNAITVVTYHRAKGLEWPVVILSDLGREPKTRVWSPSVVGGGAEAGDPLAGRRARLWQHPFGGPTSKDELADAANSHPEAQDIDRREENEELRLLYVGFTRARERLILSHTAAGTGWVDRVSGMAALLPLVPPGGWPDGVEPADGVSVQIPDIGSNGVIRRLSLQDLSAAIEPAAVCERWLASDVGGPVSESAERYVNPSVQLPGDGLKVGEVEELSSGISSENRAGRDSRRDAGHAVHDYFAALPSLEGLDRALKLNVAERCIEGRGSVGEIEAGALVDAGDAFVAWVGSRYPGATWLTEVPVSAPRAGGGQWRGVIDLVLLVGEGDAVVIDHKSTRVDRAGVASVAKHYTGQLAAYEEALTSQGFEVVGMWVHLPLAGALGRVARKV